jgi:fucose permease
VRLSLIVLASLAFISLGLPDGLLGVAWPSIRGSFALDLDAIGVLLATATAGYVASSFSSGQLLRHMNVGAVLAISCGLTSSGLLGYVVAPRWSLMIALAVVLGLGAGAVDSSLNAYAARYFGARTLNWLHACYGIGAATGPLIMTAVLSAGLSWQRGYAIVGGAQIVLALSFAVTVRWWSDTSGNGVRSRTDDSARLMTTLRLPGARLAIAAFFVYAGVEGSFGVWTYTLLTETRSVAASHAGAIVSGFWASLTGGRILAAFAGGRMSAARMLMLALVGVVVGAALVWANVNNALTDVGILLAGCACGPVFPTLVATTPARLGARHAANAVGFQIAAAAVGLALLPGLVGTAADALGIEIIAAALLALALALIVVYKMLDATAPALSDQQRTRDASLSSSPGCEF